MSLATDGKYTSIEHLIKNHFHVLFHELLDYDVESAPNADLLVLDKRDENYDRIA